MATEKLTHIPYKISPEDADYMRSLMSQFQSVDNALRYSSTIEGQVKWTKKLEGIRNNIARAHETLWAKYGNRDEELKYQDRSFPPQLQIHLYTNELILSYKKKGLLQRLREKLS